LDGAVDGAAMPESGQLSCPGGTPIARVAAEARHARGTAPNPPLRRRARSRAASRTTEITDLPELAMQQRSISPPRRQRGRWGYILAWLIGIPVPILVLVYLLRGCT
jgi:hypothetical protein